MDDKSMKNCIICIICIVVGACSVDSVIQPSKASAPLHHNIAATFVGQESGPIIYLCATQPRVYEGHLEEDHYLQYSECPETPVR